MGVIMKKSILLALFLITLPILANNIGEQRSISDSSTTAVVSDNWGFDSHAFGIGAAVALGGVVLYKARQAWVGGYFNWMSRLVCRKKYKELEDIEKELNNCSLALFRESHPEYASPADIYKNMVKFVPVIKKETELETKLDRDSKTLQDLVARLEKLASENGILKKFDDDTRITDLDNAKIDELKIVFFSDINKDDYYSRYARAKTLAFKVWKARKRLEAIKLVLEKSQDDVGSSS
jgi:hypothetical protein